MKSATHFNWALRTCPPCGVSACSSRLKWMLKLCLHVSGHINLRCGGSPTAVQQKIMDMCHHHLVIATIPHNSNKDANHDMLSRSHVGREMTAAVMCVTKTAFIIVIVTISIIVVIVNRYRHCRSGQCGSPCVAVHINLQRIMVDTDLRAVVVVSPFWSLL